MSDVIPIQAIQTVSGGWIDVCDPDPAHIHIEDIAHALSNQWRFGGHTLGFYSVAQHCALCCRWALAHKLSRREQRAALLHDASEAFLVDLPRPIKRHSGIKEAYAASEDRLMVLISQKFEFDWPLSPEVHLIDARMLWTEKRDLLAPASWGDAPCHPFPERIDPVGPPAAKDLFMAEFRNVCN